MPDANVVFSISDDQLILTTPPDLLNVCKHCPELHILVLRVASPENIRELAAALLHLAEHVNDGR